MNEFKNGDKVYWDNSIGRYIGDDPYDPEISFVIDLHTKELGTITKVFLSSEPPISQRELNGKALFELFESVWDEVHGAKRDVDWTNNVYPEYQEVYMRIAEKLNYTAEE